MGKANRAFIRAVVSKLFRPPEFSNLQRDGKRNRNLFSFPGRKFSFRIFGRLDHHFVLFQFQNAPYLAAGNKHCPRTYPADDKGFVQCSDRLSGDDIKDDAFLFIRNHREVQREIFAGTGFGDDHTVLGSDEIVFLHLGDDITDKFSGIFETVAPGENPLDVLNRNLAPLNGEGCYLVCDNICRIHVRPDVFRAVVCCETDHDHRL